MVIRISREGRSKLFALSCVPILLASLAGVSAAALGEEPTAAETPSIQSAAAPQNSGPGAESLSPRETELESRFAATATPPSGAAEMLSPLGAAGAFLFVLSLATIGAFLISHVMKGRGAFRRGKHPTPVYERLQVLETVPLGQRRHLTVIEAGGEVHLLGLGPGSISYLTRLSSKPPAEQVERENAERAVARSAPVPSLLNKLATADAVSSADNFRSQYQQLRAKLSGK